MTKLLRWIVPAAGAWILALPATAQDCPAGRVCASSPQSVVAAMQAAGLQAKLERDKDETAPDENGPDYISSAASGYKFSVYFKDCKKGVGCGSLEFLIDFEKDGAESLAAANDWNNKKRFATMFLETSGSIGLSYDVSTVGGLDPANFADVLDWWDNGVLGILKGWFDDHKGTAAKPWTPTPKPAAGGTLAGTPTLGD